ncbi:MAG: N-acetylmuramoyl-L-alanine amidase (EC [uncultured Thiotrichaceae bacterium]|uniref:N-acetylmuramoyl-L-alanine amidase n=1 Tax=uncultured Thiotrichaceae bacterium TaxID=298394 RepID=A0A6S6TFH0_9GAMM|nr:MAG: N-acetylmuramoyl-L-alanine amidase (EC [uncultured Thiotrichaceae bacterium]
MKNFLLAITLAFSCYASTLMANNNAVIAIDIGHTLKNHGSTSARGVGEFHFNKTIATQLQAKLKEQGYPNTLLINPEGKKIRLKERTQFAHKHKADVFISIHHDSMQLQFLKRWRYQGKEYLHGERFKGYSLFISQQTQHKKENLQLANAIADSMLESRFVPTLHHAMPIKGENRKLLDKTKGIYAFPELAVLRTARMPAILVECGIIVNKDEEVLLSNKEYQKRISDAIAIGIMKFLEEQ